MNVKRLIAAAASCLLAGLSSVYGAVWFETGIPNYTVWPADGADRVVPGVGTWTGTQGADLLGAPGEKVLSFGTSDAHPLEFQPLAPLATGADGVVEVTFEIQFAAGAETPVINPEMKGALTVLDRDGRTEFAGLQLDARSGTNVWVCLTGAEPRLNTPTQVTIALRTVGDAHQVKYLVDGAALRTAAGEWGPVAFLGASQQVVGAGCVGAGELAGLSAKTSLEVDEVVLTVPDLAWMTLVSVQANGVVLAPAADGTYRVPQGASVAVTFAPETGAFLDNTTMVFQMTDSMTLPEEGRPQVIPPSEILVINEIMASNGSTLLTANRQAGLDWIELYNKSDADVDLTGWYLSDNPTKAQAKWARIEGSCVVPAHGYKVVWADSTYLGFTETEAYTRIGLSSDGETAFLATPDGEMVHSVTFGQQIKDVSIGVGNHAETLVAANAPAEWRVAGGTWTPCTGTVGTSAATGAGFTVAVQPTPASTPVTQVVAALDGTVRCEGAEARIVAEGTLLLARPGLYSFRCLGPGSSTLVLSRGDLNWEMEYPSVATTFSLPEAGAYDVKLVTVARAGVAAPELSVGAGELDPEEDAAAYAPLGTDGAFAHTGLLAANLSTNILDAVQTAGAFDWRTTFPVEAAPAPADTVQLRLRVADGFVARLNGKTFAERPAAATTKDAALAEVVLDVPAALFEAGENVLRVTVLNDDPADTEMLLAAELQWSKAGGDMAYYFPRPTPGAANGVDAKDGPTPKVVFSEPHGYKTAAFMLALSCPDDPAAEIYYTLDGTTPSVKKTRYTGPIAISQTTVVRAAAPNADSVLQNDTSATYLFVDDILLQSGTPTGFPANGTVNNQAITYGMHTGVTGSSEWRPRLLDGFTNSIATVSIVTDPANLFNAATGIYVNASNGGRSWERKTMVEVFSPTNAAAEFSAVCGLRIRGAYSRGSGYPKHSFRLFFRNEYGQSKLRFPLFEKEGADVFDKIDLRAAQNYSWANGSDRFTFIEECFSRDAQGDLGQSYHRSRYYNLFINGIYWGVYQTEERTSGDFGETYFGGSADDYDVVRTAQPGYVTGVVEGQELGWYNFWNLSVNQGYGAAYPNNYNLVRGLNADGSPNPALPIYLNPTNVAVYMLTSHFASDSDAPATSGSDKANNNAQLWNRYNGTNVLGGIAQTGWIFHRHDAEHSLGTAEGYAQDSLDRGTERAHPNMRLYQNFNPAELNYKLLDNAEYKTLFGDLVYRACLKPGGALTAPESRRRLQRRMDELDSAVVCESARWGYARNANFTRNQWLAACARLQEFTDRRVPYLIQYYRNRGWYPSLDAPQVVTALGQRVTGGETFGENEAVYFAEGTDGTVYYTLDGSDPRREGGAVNTTAQQYTGWLGATDDRTMIEQGGTWKYSDWGSEPAADGQGNKWMSAAYDDASWSAGKGALGFKSGLTFATTLPRYVDHGASGTQVTTFYFRRTVTLPADAATATSLTVTAYLDDGYVLYVNGVEVGRSALMPTGAIGYGTFTTGFIDPANVENTFTIPSGLLKAGTNVIAAEVHQCNATSSDIAWDCAITYPVRSGASGGIVVPPSGATVKARVLSAAGEWSALEEVAVVGTAPGDALADSVRFHSFMGIPPEPSDGDTDEWITLTNLSATTSFDLAGMKVVVLKAGEKMSKAKCAFSLGELTLPAGGSVTLHQADYVQDGWTKITNGDVLLYLYDKDGTREIQTSSVNQKLFPTVIADDAGPGGGAWLVATAFESVTTPDDWKASFERVRMEATDRNGVVIDTTGYYLPASLVPGGDGTVKPVLDPAVVQPAFVESAAGAGDAVVPSGETVRLTVRAQPGLYYAILTSETLDGTYAAAEAVAGEVKVQAAAGESVLVFTVRKKAAKSAFYKAVVTDRE